MGDDIRVTVIATGFDHGGLRAAREERTRGRATATRASTSASATRS